MRVRENGLLFCVGSTCIYHIECMNYTILVFESFGFCMGLYMKYMQPPIKWYVFIRRETRQDLSKPHIRRFLSCDASYRLRYERRVLREDRDIGLKSGHLRSNLSHYTIYFLRLRMFLRLGAIARNFWTCSKRYDVLRIPRCLESWATESHRVSHYTISLRHCRRAGIALRHKLKTV